MTKVYTKTGDDGTTGLIGGSRVKKFNNRLEAYGTIDELNSAIGVIAAYLLDDHDLKVIRNIQNLLFVIGSHLATDESAQELKTQLPCEESDIELLENEIDVITTELPPLRHFILPGGCPAAAYAHLARAICRRAERRIVEMAEMIEVDKQLVKYINRLSDYLFVLSRKLNVQEDYSEVFWKPNKK
ncbi:MAG: cob(I)yrinic acid a,c-diamide adenosyltransferase [Mangrovibacterium sp.]